MDAGDLKKWRKRLGYNQFEAAKRLGVRRASVQNWEQELWPIPGVIELACYQIMRRWKQRREFGPVLLVYTDEPIWQGSQGPYQVSILHAAVYRNNETAMQHVEQQKKDPNFINPVISTTSELLQEIAPKSRRHRSGAVVE
jgi:DNA-binding XRE family transcriptional regulator